MVALTLVVIVRSVVVGVDVILVDAVLFKKCAVAFGDVILR